MADAYKTVATVDLQSSGEPWIVTVTPTIMSGTVIRWFRSEAAADKCEPVVSASRECVQIHDPRSFSLAERDAVLPVADECRRLLVLDKRDPVKARATHESPLFGDLRPVAKGDSVRGDRP